MKTIFLVIVIFVGFWCYISVIYIILNGIGKEFSDWENSINERREELERRKEELERRREALRLRILNQQKRDKLRGKNQCGE